MKYVINTNDSHQETVFQEPSLYQVILHNDGFTPMELVVEVLEQFFYMERSLATEVMFKAHVEGRARCGWYSKDYAEAKVAQVAVFVRKREYPLSCSMEVAVPFDER